MAAIPLNVTQWDHKTPSDFTQSGIDSDGASKSLEVSVMSSYTFYVSIQSLSPFQQRITPCHIQKRTK
ncbi:hypothetical protein CHS0354_021863 [Potamilus streckersoni]|uniref:Uncharacterized protein n=1 Tax=Potamilus streckersoni TaxID=2493646 RepID=A0AAE0SEQ4_9BIVA|nr:hypothetical protein CHS0354_021863 [Potamilus streckersoni]